MVKNLRKLRINARLSQQELADAVGITQQSINKYENHGVEPDIYMLCKLSDYFHITVDYLVGHTPVPDQIATEELELTSAEFSFIKDFRKLSENKRKSIRLIMQNYLKHK